MNISTKNKKKEEKIFVTLLIKIKKLKIKKIKRKSHGINGIEDSKQQ